MSTRYDRLSEAAISSLAQDSAATHAHVGAVLMFEADALRTPEGGIDIERIRAHAASQLHRAPRYRQRLARVPLENSPVWVDDDHFSLDYHVRHTSLPRPGDESQLKRLVARIMSQQLDRERPLWELWIVEGVDGDRFASVFKAHASMIDGPRGVDLLSLLLASEPTDEIGEAREFAPRLAPSQLYLLRDEILRRVRYPLELARDVGGALTRPQAFASSVEARARTWVDSLTRLGREPTETLLNGQIGPHRQIDWVGMELADVRAVKRRLGCTVHELVLATATGAMRRFLERRGVGLRSFELTASTPVSVQSSSDTTPGHIAIQTVRLPVGEVEALDQLELVCRATRGLTRASGAIPADDLAGATRWTASTLLSRGVLALDQADACNLVVTNVPGPQVPLYLLPSRLLACHPQAPLAPNHALSIALFSYAGRLTWGLNADRERLPDLALLVDEIVASFSELRVAAGLEWSRRALGRRLRARRRLDSSGERAEL